MGLRLLVEEHRAQRPPLGVLQAKWVRNVFESVDRKSHGSITRASVPRLLAAANTSASIKLPRSQQRLSLAHVSAVLAELLVAKGSPIRALFDE